MFGSALSNSPQEQHDVGVRRPRGTDRPVCECVNAGERATQNNRKCLVGGTNTRLHCGRKPLHLTTRVVWK